MDMADIFYSTQGKALSLLGQPQSYAYSRLGVLPELTGKPWDNHALCLVASFCPTTIRVVIGEETTDAQMGRITVYVDPQTHTITKIDQSKEVPIYAEARAYYAIGSTI